GVRDFSDRSPGRGDQDRAARRQPGRDVFDRRRHLFPVLLLRLAARETAAGAPCLWSSRMISIRKVSKSFGSFQVLKDCNAEVARGEVVVICGPSGSGKS